MIPVRHTYAILFLCLLLPMLSAGQSPLGTKFTYQGRLTDNGSLANGLYDFRFTLWRDPTNPSGSQQVGPPVLASGVQVIEGLYSTTLDFGVVPHGNGFDRWLQIQVAPAGGSLVTLAPRRAVTAAPASIMAVTAVDAQDADTVDGMHGAEFATSSHTHPEYAPVSHSHSQYALNNHLHSSLSAADGIPTESLVIDDDGDVGIGTTSPDGQLHVVGPIRLGNESGTGEAPFVSGPNPYQGLVVRRANSTSNSNGSVVARTANQTLVRDGTNGGFWINSAAFSSAIVVWQGVDSNGTVLGGYHEIVGTFTALSLQITEDADDLVSFRCQFGPIQGHCTEVSLFREAGEPDWVGTITSTFDQ